MKLIYSNETNGFKRYIMNIPNENENYYNNNECEIIKSNVINLNTEYKQIDCKYLITSGFVKIKINAENDKEELYINKYINIESLELNENINTISVKLCCIQM